MTLSINFHPEVQILNHLSSYIPQSLTQSLLHKKGRTQGGTPPF